MFPIDATVISTRRFTCFTLFSSDALAHLDTEEKLRFLSII